MTLAERIKNVAGFGFTERQAGFLVTVMLHAGVCLRRQYCGYAGIVRGQKSRDFFEALVARRCATPYACGHNKAQVYHVHRKALYRAIGEPDARLRKSATLAQAVERLMILDHVLAWRDVMWLGSEREKLTHFTIHTPVPREELPSVTFGRGRHTTVRHFVDRLPIGVTADGQTHIFLYLVADPVPVEFRAFLHRYAGLLRAVPKWTIRLLVPQHLSEAATTYERAFREEFGSALRPALIDELKWYFEHRQTGNEGDPARMRRAQRAFSAPRFRALFRAWREHGERALNLAMSPLIADAIARGTGQLECHVVTRQYFHCAPLVGLA
jgi:hypothetical protein